MASNCGATERAQPGKPLGNTATTATRTNSAVITTVPESASAGISRKPVSQSPASAYDQAASIGTSGGWST